jgi:hypothetical protein
MVAVGGIVTPQKRKEPLTPPMDLDEPGIRIEPAGVADRAWRYQINGEEVPYEPTSSISLFHQQIEEEFRLPLATKRKRQSAADHADNGEGGMEVVNDESSVSVAAREGEGGVASGDAAKKMLETIGRLCFGARKEMDSTIRIGNMLSTGLMEVFPLQREAKDHPELVHTTAFIGKMETLSRNSRKFAQAADRLKARLSADSQYDSLLLSLRPYCTLVHLSYNHTAVQLDAGSGVEAAMKKDKEKEKAGITASLSRHQSQPCVLRLPRRLSPIFSHLSITLSHRPGMQTVERVILSSWHMTCPPFPVDENVQDALDYARKMLQIQRWMDAFYRAALQHTQLTVAEDATGLQIKHHASGLQCEIRLHLASQSSGIRINSSSSTSTSSSTDADAAGAARAHPVPPLTQPAEAAHVWVSMSECSNDNQRAPLLYQLLTAVLQRCQREQILAECRRASLIVFTQRDELQTQRLMLRWGHEHCWESWSSLMDPMPGWKVWYQQCSRQHWCAALLACSPSALILDQSPLQGVLVQVGHPTRQEIQCPWPNPDLSWQSYLMVAFRLLHPLR